MGGDGLCHPSPPPLQALLLKAHEVEVMKKRAEDKVERQLRFPTAAEAPTAVRPHGPPQNSLLGWGLRVGGVAVLRAGLFLPPSPPPSNMEWELWGGN